MRQIHSTRDQINGGSSTYFLCDSIEEYNQQVRKYRERAERCTWEHITIDTNITCEPTVTVSDGFATYGGKKIRAKGISCWELVGLRGSNSIYIINPTTIERMDSVKGENWWV